VGRRRALPKEAPVNALVSDRILSVLEASLNVLFRQPWISIQEGVDLRTPLALSIGAASIRTATPAAALN